MSEKDGSQSKTNILNYVFAILFGIGVAGIILLLNKKPKPEMIAILPTFTDTPMVVYIVGQVKQPGLYELDQGSRISDLVDTAGGFTDKADTTAVNLASFLMDGQQIIIPNIEDAHLDSQLASSSDHDPGFPININSCQKEDLMTLPGIGEIKAEAILAYREENGAFEVIEDIMKVSGIGETIFESIKDKITVK